MISTRSGALVIDTVVCLTLAKWETVSGRFGGYLRRKCTVTRDGINLIVQDGDLVVPGVSGSPIISTDGKAIARASTASVVIPTLVSHVRFY